jgi:carboxymethylenebutenolidase
MNRRLFLENLTVLPALAQIVPADDSRLDTARVSYDAAGTKINGYLAKPKGGGKRPAVMVISENRGLTPHIQDVARRMALEGFLAFAPDMLTPLGGTPADESQAPAMIGKLNADETVARLAAGVAFLAKNAECTGKVGVVGFSWGGGMVNRVMAAGASLNAGVAYYGAQIPAADVPKISGPLLLHYAGNDARIDAGIPDYEAALKANNKVYQIYIYEGAAHSFNNDTGGGYNKEAAQLAWGRTVAFFKKYLA